MCLGGREDPEVRGGGEGGFKTSFFLSLLPSPPPTHPRTLKLLPAAVKKKELSWRLWRPNCILNKFLSVSVISDLNEDTERSQKRVKARINFICGLGSLSYLQTFRLFIPYPSLMSDRG